MRARPGESEWSLVFFTVLTQAAVGTCVAGVVFRITPGPEAWIAPALLAVGGLAAALHLGRIGHAKFALSNLGRSWLSREAALAGAFGAALVVALLLPGIPALRIAAAAIGVGLAAAIPRIYMIRTVPAWNTWMTPAAFLLTAAILGSAVVAVTMPEVSRPVLLTVVAAVILQIDVAMRHDRRFGRGKHRGLFGLRIVLAVLGAAGMLMDAPALVAPASASLLLSEVLGRYLFYASHRRVGL